ncbi:hypothetical protein FOA52_013866 [Chlamydomonas sp. UWO 241]|nr:hypothetical protein FOA52_013866 [Chlamydomonas sp. UWO 241]
MAKPNGCGDLLRALGRGRPDTRTSTTHAHPDTSPPNRMGVLKVLLVKLEDLADKDAIGKTDPYVKLEVIKDGFFDKTVGKAQSSKKQDDCNPVYNEEFSFHFDELTKMELHLKIMDDDTISDDKVGAGEIKLDKEDLQPNLPKTFRIKVDNNLFSKDAYATLVLTWTP